MADHNDFTTRPVVGDRASSGHDDRRTHDSVGNDGTSVDTTSTRETVGTSDRTAAATAPLTTSQWEDGLEAPTTSRTTPPARDGWRRNAACDGTDTDTWFDVESPTIVPHALATLCDGCPVRGDCLLDAVAKGDLDYGIRGGMTPKQRRMWAGKEGLARHGTLTGYANDRCRCDLCSAAGAEYDRDRRATVGRQAVAS